MGIQERASRGPQSGGINLFAGLGAKLEQREEEAEEAQASANPSPEAAE